MTKKDEEKSRSELQKECERLREQVERLHQVEADKERLISSLRLSERRLRTLAESTSDCVWELNESMEYTYVSPRIEDLLGYQPEDLMGRTPFDFMPAREAKLAAEAFEEFLEERRLFTGYENHRWHRSGRLVAVETIGIPVYEHDEIRGFRGVDRNITARKEAQQQLRRAHKEMARRVEERTAELRAANIQLEEEIADRRQAQRELRDLSRRLNTLVEAIPDALYFKDADGNNLVVNRAFEEFFGVESSEVVGKKDEEFMPQRLAEICRKSDEEALQQDEPLRAEEQWPTPGGRVRWFETVKCRLLDDEGECRGLVGVSRDITERKQMEGELRRKEERLSALMANLPGMAYRCRNDRHWTMEFMSQGVRDLTGFGPDELVENEERSYADLIHPEDREKVRDKVESAVEAGEPFRMTYRVRCANGEQKWVWEQGRATGNPPEETTVLEGFVTDITRRVEAEKALRESEERYRSLVENVPLETIIIKRDPLRFVYANFSEGRLLGYTADRLRDMSQNAIMQLIHPDDREMVAERMEQRLEGNRPRGESYEIRMMARDGSIRWVRAYANKITYEGEPAILGLFVDLTERRRVETELRETRERYRKLVDNSIQGMVVFQGYPPTISYVNPGIRNILGYSPEELVEWSGEKVLGLLHPADREKAVTRYKRRTRGEEAPSNYRVRLFARDGSVRWVRVHGVRTEWEGQPCSMATYVDITAEKRREQELKTARKRLERLLEASETAVVAINRDMRIVSVNDVLREVRPEWDLTDEPRCSDILCGPAGKDVCERCPVEKTFEDGESHQALEILEHEDGEKMLRIVSVPGPAVAAEPDVAYAVFQEIRLPS